jgi:hypothetical protein
MISILESASPRASTASVRNRAGFTWFVITACALLGCASDAGTGAHDAGPTCVDPADGPPTDIFCTGLYENRDPAQYAKTAVPYTPGVTFWSDGAEKHRYLYLPPSTKIDTSNMDAWKFPVGTKVWKEFKVNGALVETRLLWKRPDATWVHGTYIWDAAAKNATLNTATVPILLNGGYEIPASRTCQKCHGGASDVLLGIEAVALALPTAQGVTLTSLAAAGSLSAAPAKTAITLPEDETGKAAAALGYLHANCGMACHSTRGISGFTQLHTRLRADEFWPDADAGLGTVTTTDAYVTGLNKDVILATFTQAFPGAKVITPGSHDSSLTWILAHLRGEHQMPPLVSHQIDEVGTQELADWIDALPK